MFYYIMSPRDPIKKREYERKYLSIPKNREKKRQRDLAYYYKNRAKKLEYNRNYRINYRKQYPEKIKEQNRRYYHHHKEKLAQYRANHKKQRHAGNVARKIPLANECSICGAPTKLLRHHPDYDKPLEVVTLCYKCHEKLHDSGCL